MLIIRGLADSFYGGCLIQRDARQANYSPYYKKSATVGVNYSLTITLSMVLKEDALEDILFSINNLLFCFRVSLIVSPVYDLRDRFVHEERDEAYDSSLEEIERNENRKEQ